MHACMHAFVVEMKPGSCSLCLVWSATSGQELSAGGHQTHDLQPIPPPINANTMGLLEPGRLSLALGFAAAATAAAAANRSSTAQARIYAVSSTNRPKECVTRLRWDQNVPIIELLC